MSVGRSSPSLRDVGPIVLLMICAFGQPGGALAQDALDRTTCFAARLPRATSRPEPPTTDPERAIRTPPDATSLANKSLQAAWENYLRLWRAHHDDPSDLAIRGYLGLSIDPDSASNRNHRLSAKRGRTSIRSVRWKARSYAQIDTPHFVIYSRADQEASLRLADDLEQCYWVWTQMFFPLWEGAAQVGVQLSNLSPDQSPGEYLNEDSHRITIKRRMKVILFASAQQYAETLSPQVPGIEQSTGYYSDDSQTTYLYASKEDDAATRRHELVHQLFREATRSGLGKTMPGQQRDFWLIEGVAGYFESLSMAANRDSLAGMATLGGWDSPRLQFARYRVLAGGDEFPLADLRRDGHLAAQQRSDLARWYSHAIAQTHRLLDGQDPAARLWVYRKLAELYRVKVDWGPDPADPSPPQDSSLVDFLTIDDETVTANPARGPLTELCLTRCHLTSAAIQTLPSSPTMRWLDLSHLPIANGDVQRLVPQPTSIEQLSLEATRCDDGLADWIKQATELRELDLSWTVVGDQVTSAISSKKIEVLWLTGSKITDQTIGAVDSLPALTSFDVQRTGVSAAALDRLRGKRGQLEINPLQLRD